MSTAVLQNNSFFVLPEKPSFASAKTFCDKWEFSLNLLVSIECVFNSQLQFAQFNENAPCVSIL